MSDIFYCSSILSTAKPRHASSLPVASATTCVRSSRLTERRAKLPPRDSDPVEPTATGLSAMLDAVESTSRPIPLKLGNPNPPRLSSIRISVTRLLRRGCTTLGAWGKAMQKLRIELFGLGVGDRSRAPPNPSYAVEARTEGISVVVRRSKDHFLSPIATFSYACRCRCLSAHLLRPRRLLPIPGSRRHHLRHPSSQCVFLPYMPPRTAIPLPLPPVVIGSPPDPDPRRVIALAL
jgi:hypothetical protein